MPRKGRRPKRREWKGEGEVLAGLTAPDSPALVKPFEGCAFDERAAQAAVDFFRYLRHSKGKTWAGKPFALEGWQQRIIRAVFGWMRPDGTRLIRTLYLEIPRKSGKSTLAAGIALYLLMADREPVAEIYGAADDKETAAIVFEEATRMVENSPDLSRYAEVFTTSIYVQDTGSSYKVLAKAPKGKHGLNPHGVVLDELHTLRSQQVYNALTTAQGARSQPLIVQITTAGYDRNSICWEQHDYAMQIQEGLIDDPSFLGVIYTVGDSDSWKSEATWYKANPNLGVSVPIDYLRSEFVKARANPSKENAFKQLYLNIWTEQQSRWLPVELWDACKGAAITEEEFVGAEVWGGLDLANTQDLNALVWVKRRQEEREVKERGEDGKKRMVVKAVDVYDILPRLWIPEQASALESRSALQKMYYKWADEGLITLTEGNVMDHDFIREQVNQDFGNMQVRELAYDPFFAIQVVSKLFEDGLPMLEFRQRFENMGPAIDVMEMLILNAQLRHGGNTLLRWCFKNIVARRNPTGLVRFDKAASQEKIDPMVALAMALGRAAPDQDAGPMEIVVI